ncbi:cation diffusion facilitator family transporter [Streptomyces lydicus]|uniref:cation diffusion facilitator family transporter n=1 Tax=Streptomyces lydicus TaxID=47763 RepID=UPI0036F91CD8
MAGNHPHPHGPDRPAPLAAAPTGHDGYGDPAGHGSHHERPAADGNADHDPHDATHDPAGHGSHHAPSAPHPHAAARGGPEAVQAQAQAQAQAHAHAQAHGHGGWWARVWHRLGHVVVPHSHETVDKVDAAMETSREGMRTLWLSLGVLGLTCAVEAVIVAVSGSVALLGDTLHNGADALTAVPLGIAFVLGRRAANRRYTYGYGRAEDLAGIAIVLTIAVSSLLAAYEAVDRLLHPREVTHLWAVALAAVAGFVGNEWVARYRIRTGRRIGSAALVADGLHARTDGFTSLAVLLGAGGAALGWRLADPLIGLLITAAILMVLRDAAREVYRRLMDSVDPALLDTAESTLRAVDGVRGIGQVRMRWIGHSLRAEAEIVVDSALTVVQAHALAVAAEHALIHAVPRLTAATVHTDHTAAAGTDPHAALAHHTAV